MPKGLKRYYGQGDLHFITSSCYRRQPLLGSAWSRNLFVRIAGEVRERYGFALAGYVVMPEHFHLLLSEPRRATLSTVLQVLKQRVSRILRRRTSKAARAQLRLWEQGSLPPRLWQRRFFDFNVWSAKKRNEKLHYMHMNPVKRKLVARPEQWPWSSYNFYARRGAVLLSLDRE